MQDASVSITPSPASSALKFSLIQKLSHLGTAHSEATMEDLTQKLLVAFWISGSLSALVSFSQHSHSKACCSNKNERMMSRIKQQRLYWIAGENLMGEGEDNYILSC